MFNCFTVALALLSHWTKYVFICCMLLFQRNDAVFQACLQQLLPDQQVALSDALNTAAAPTAS